MYFCYCCLKGKAKTSYNCIKSQYAAVGKNSGNDVNPSIKLRVKKGY